MPPATCRIVMSRLSPRLMMRRVSGAAGIATSRGASGRRAALSPLRGGMGGVPQVRRLRAGRRRDRAGCRPSSIKPRYLRSPPGGEEVAQ